jgi:GntR family transcriptional regulator/MocR family aminotransferase
MIAIDRKSPIALHRQIYNAYRAGIVSGSFRPKQRIPSSRVLASELGVSRFPVLNAYNQLLAEGYLESRVGAGTVVSSSLPDKLMSSASTGVRLAGSRSGPRSVVPRDGKYPLSPAAPWLGGWGAFGVGQVAADQFPINIWSDLIRRRTRKMDLKSFHYGHYMGSEALRKAIANYLRTARSLRCDWEQVMIVSGSQQALEISARVLLDAGSSVWLEDPGYSLARGAFALTGCRLIPVPTDHEGMDVATGIKRCSKARAAFVTPSHQFPLGVTMSASRRFQLLDWARSSGSWVIEDDYDSEYRYESLPIASLQGLDTSDRVIYIGTFSKVLFPSLRLGYVVIPLDLVHRFLTIRRTTDIAPPTFFQDVLVDFIEEGHFARHIRRMRVLYSERRRALANSLGDEMQGLVEIVGGEAGMHLTVTLPNGASDLEISERASRQKLSLWPLSPSYMRARAPQGFILGFGSTSVADMPHAVRKLRDLLTAS